MSIDAVDPYGNRVVIPKEIIPYAEINSRHEVTDSPERVVQRPALMFSNCKEPQSSKTETCENHYLRSINWYDTLLISARKVDGQWTAYRCICNPPLEQIKTLFRTTTNVL